MNKEQQDIEPKVKITVVEPKYDNLLSFATAYNPQGFDLYNASFEKRDVPSQEALDSSRRIDRTTRPEGRGLWQIAVRAERNSLLDGISKYKEDINRLLTEKGTNLRAEDIDRMVRFLPNYNFPYYNKLVKKALEGLATSTGTTSKADYDYIAASRILNEDAERALLTLLAVSRNNELINFSIKPPPSRSGIPVNYNERGNAFISLANPGNVIMESINKKETKIDNVDTSGIDKVINMITDKIQTLYEEIELTRDLQPLYTMASPQNPVQKSLFYLREKLLSNSINYKDLTALADTINKYLGLRRSKYLMSLAMPFTTRNARIPTLISAPSATFTLKSVAPLTTNALGNVAFVFQPYLLGKAGSTMTGLNINNNVALVGTGVSNFFLGYACGQALPADFYVRYRIVSAGLRVYTYPSSNNDNGLLTISVSYDPLNFGVVGATMPEAQQYGDFSNIENGFFKQTTTIASREVQEHVYVPLDESFWDYQPMSTMKLGFSWAGYITGAAASTSIARLELITNYEALVDNEFTDYLPSESPVAESDPKLVFSAIAEMKNKDQPLTTRNVKEVLEEATLGGTTDMDLKLPPSSKDMNSKKEELNNQSIILKGIVTDVVKKLPEQQKENWISALLDKASPIVQPIITTVFRSLFPMVGKLFL